MAHATASRLLDLLVLLQTRPEWTATDLAARVGVGDRTIRSDVARLRELGYPIDSTPGRAGGYRMGRGGKIPPLLLDDDDAVLVAVALRLLSQAPGMAEDAELVSTKLERSLPDRVRRRVRALLDSLDVGSSNTASNVPIPAVDAALLSDLAAAIRDRAGLRIRYGPQQEELEVDPYRLVSWQQRWYVVGRVRPDGRWQALRVDWVELRVPGAGRFSEHPLPGGDYSSFVLGDVASRGWSVHARIAVDAPAQEVLARINPAVGTVEPLGPDRCVLVTGADSLEMIAVWVGMLGLDFHVDEPVELREHVRAVGARYARAVEA